ncbi:hypothetical protein ACOYR1_14110 [Thalassotalea piscium]
MNLLPTRSVLSYCQSFDLSNFTELPTPVSQLLHDVTSSINDLFLDDEDIALLNRGIENYLIDVENAYTGHIIDSSYVNSSLYNQDIDKLVNSYSPLVPSDVLLVFALNKLVNSINCDPIDHLWIAFGEASQAFALAKISTAIIETIVCHEEFLDQMPIDLLYEWKNYKKSNRKGGKESSRRMADQQEKLFIRARKIALHIWGKYPDTSPKKMAELIKTHFNEKDGHLLPPDTVPKVAKISDAIKSIVPKGVPMRVSIKQANFISEHGAIIATQIAEFDKP